MDNTEHIKRLEDFTPHTANFTESRAGTLTVCIGNTWNLRRAYSKSEYPRDYVSADTIGEGLFRWVSGTGSSTGSSTESGIHQQSPQAPPLEYRKLTHKVLRRESTFLAYKFNAGSEYIRMINASIKYHTAACLTLPAFNTPSVSLRMASDATFLIIVDIHNIILGYYRIGWVSTMTACREQKIQLTSPMTTSHKNVVYVKEPCITMTNEHIAELNLVPLMSYLPAERQPIGTCELYRFPSKPTE